MTTDATESSYDRVPYISVAFRETHPAWQQAVGHLFGLGPPAVENARILELGCASGGNILPIAAAYPGCAVLGIDLSSRQIEFGRQAVAATGLTNIELRHQSIMDLPASEGPFDYILCHGVFSWVPPEVQERILEICHRQLSPRGVAYISFNTYPGWHVRMWAREIMLFHAGGIPEDSRRLREAVDFLKAIVESPAARTLAPMSLLKAELETMRNKQPEYLLHEYLEVHNHPFYFHQFVARCQAHNLQYLGDARVNGLLLPGSSPALQRVLEGAQGDVVRIEQYADFVRNQMFRRALLCHEGAKLDRRGAEQRIVQMAIASPLAPDRSSGTIASDQEMRFNAPDGAQVRSALPVIKAALFYIHEAFPAALRFEEVCARVRTVIRMSDEEFGRQRDLLAESLVHYWLLGMIQAYVTPPRFASTLTEKPRTTPVARHEAARGGHVTNLRHETYQLNPEQCKVVQLCDGTRTRAQIAQTLGITNPQMLDELLYKLTKAGFLLE